MKMSISLDDELARRVQRAAEVKGITISAFIAKILGEALNHCQQYESQPFRLVTVRGGQTRRGVDLDLPRELDVQDEVIRFEGRSH